MQRASYEAANHEAAPGSSAPSNTAPGNTAPSNIAPPVSPPREAASRSAVISVRGEATLMVDPEVADLTVVITAQARDRREAFERLVKRNDEVLDLARSYGDSIDHVESTGVSVAPELRKGKDEKIRSYSGAVRIRVAVADLAILGELVARLAEFEAVTIDGPQWRLRRSSPVYREARGRAVAEAVTRARDYAEAVGSRITGLIELADTGLTTSVVPGKDRPLAAVFHGSRALSAPAPEPPPLDLEPQQQTVYASVEARFHAAQPDLPIT